MNFEGTKMALHDILVKLVCEAIEQYEKAASVSIRKELPTHSIPELHLAPIIMCASRIAFDIPALIHRRKNLLRNAETVTFTETCEFKGGYLEISYLIDFDGPEFIIVTGHHIGKS